MSTKNENLEGNIPAAKKPKQRQTLHHATPLFVQHAPVSNLTITPLVVAEHGTVTVSVTYLNTAQPIPDVIFIYFLNITTGLVTACNPPFGQIVNPNGNTFTLTIGTLSGGATQQDLQIYVFSSGGGVISTLRIYKQGTTPPGPVTSQISTASNLVLLSITT